MVKSRTHLPKSPTGIQGLDEITGGGLPKGRSTLVCGSAGCGKTLLAMEFMVRGATQFDEPGVFMALEETAEDLTKNVASLGFDLKDLVTRKKIVLDFVYIEPGEIEESGEYDLEGLFIRLGQAIDSIGAKRVVLDTIESLFSGLPNTFILRAELRRLFRWLKDKGVTAVITGERGETTLTRQGLVRLRLRDRARPSRERAGLLAEIARDQVPRLDSRYERISVPHRRRRLFGSAGHLARLAGNCLHGLCLHRHSAL
jgi:circadian clock protein KaiC